MAALRSLLRAHALDARRDGLLAPALLLLAAAPSAADARVLESGCAALLAAHESAPLAQHTASASQAAGRGEAKEALRHLDLALEIDAEHADTWARRARLHAQEGQHAPALEAAERALALEPCHFGARAQRGAALRGLRRFGEALEAYEDALVAHPWAEGVATSAWLVQHSLALAQGTALPGGGGGPYKGDPYVDGLTGGPSI